MPKITPREKPSTVTVKTKPASQKKHVPSDWWNADSQKDLSLKLLSTAAYLKQNDQYRYRKDSLYAHLYGNLPLFGGAGTNLARISLNKTLPANRPTMSVITSITDTVVSRLEMNRPRPFFQADNSDWRQRKFAKEMNRFIAGEFYQTKFYQLRQQLRRDSCVWGTGVVKILERDNKVVLERRLATQLLVDPNEAFIGQPRQLIEMSLIDRKVLAELSPNMKGQILDKAENAYPELSADAQESVSDLLMVIEGWHLPSGPNARDGLHVQACVGLDKPIGQEEWKRETFPFENTYYCPPQVGYWGQGVAERQMGNQSAINAILMTIHNSINLVGVPRVFVETNSKVVKSHLNNNVGAIVEYSGTKPSYEVAPCVPAELYEEVQNCVNRAFQEEGISQMAANSVKPAGLDSGEAIREYDDVQQDRLATLSKADEDFATRVAYQIVWKASDIAEREGTYQTVYPDKKHGTQKVSLDRKSVEILKDPFVIQVAETSSLPNDPSGRFARITEWVQAGLYTPQEGRRLMGLPDTQQEDTLLNAAEERILWQLDKIVEDGKFDAPDPFTDLQSAKIISTQYVNLYATLKLEADRMDMLREYFQLVQDLIQASLPQPNPVIPQVPGQAPTPSPMVPNVPGIQQ